jgi:uncharacterized membrane protein YbhN (UPF0104 family)
MSGGAAPRRRWLLAGALAVLLALLAAGLVTALTFDRSTLDLLAHIHPGLLLGLAALMTSGWLAAAARMHLLARCLGHRLGLRDSFAVAVSGEFGVAVTPVGVGGTALRLATLKGRGVPLPEGTAVVAADLALDGGVAALVTVGALGLLLAPGRRALAERLGRGLTPYLSRTSSLPWDPRLALAALGLVGLLIAAGWAARRLGRRRRRAETGGESAGRSSWWQRARGAAQRVGSDLGTLVQRHPRTLGACFVLALAQLLLRYSILPLVALALVGHAPVLLLYPLQGLILLLAHLAVLPGGGGSVELAGGLALALVLPPASVGPTVLLWRLFTFHWNVFAGGAAYLVTVASERRRRAAEPAPG